MYPHQYTIKNHYQHKKRITLSVEKMIISDRYKKYKMLRTHYLFMKVFVFINLIVNIFIHN